MSRGIVKSENMNNNLLEDLQILNARLKFSLLMSKPLYFGIGFFADRLMCVN